MGRKLDILLGRTSRQEAKLKTLLGLTVSRLAVLRNQRQARCSLARGDVGQLLLQGQQDRALLRAEQVIKGQDMLDAFVIIEGYCHLLTERAALLERLKECPEELREAISGLIFAATRSGDLPELQKVRYIFASKFGKEFTAAAVELRNSCGVNPKLIQKMSTRQPSLERKVRVTKEIAAEKGIALDLEEPPAEVDPSLSQSKKQNPPADLSGLGQERFSASARQQYKDAVSAAQDAFESAAYAAAAARAAVELSRSESQGKGPDDQSAPGSGRRTRSQDRKEENVSFAGGPNPVQNYSSESDEELLEDHRNILGSDESREKPIHLLKKSPSASSSDSAEPPFYDRKASFAANSIVSRPAKLNETNIMFDKSDSEITEQEGYRGESLPTGNRVLGSGGRSRHGFEAPRHFNAAPDEGLSIKHKPSYLHPPYRKGNPVTDGDDLRSSLHGEKDEMGLGSRYGAGHSSYYSNWRYQAERNYPDPTEKLQAQRSNVGQKPVSMRTRRGF